eukprot:3235148-Pyramimonas_sp.AAC.1
MTERYYRLRPLEGTCQEWPCALFKYYEGPPLPLGISWRLTRRIRYGCTRRDALLHYRQLAADIRSEWPTHQHNKALRKLRGLGACSKKERTTCPTPI